MATYTTPGALAAALRDATHAAREIETEVEELLAALYPGWRPLFPGRRAWQFTAPDTLDVYQAIDSPAATTALHLAGFRRVTVHDHSLGKLCHGCETRVERKDPRA
jgi:hypothetical protein